jgi:manganese efflux pump family protein
MSLGHILFLLALLIPLTVDTFILSAALGLAGLPKKEQARTSIILAVFEAGMPAVGVLLGHGIGDLLGHYASYIAALVIGVAGIFMLLPAKAEEKEEREMKLLAKTRGFAVVGLGLSISLDELAIGLSLGLLGVPLLVAVIFIGIQAFIASQAGLKLGSKLNEKIREDAEKVAGIALINVAIILFVIKLLGHSV